MRSLGSARGDEVGSVERAVLRLRAAGGDQALVALQDMDLVPLLIQENYLNHRPAQAGSEVQQMQVPARELSEVAGCDLWYNGTFASFIETRSILRPKRTGPLASDSAADIQCCQAHLRRSSVAWHGCAAPWSSMQGGSGGAARYLPRFNDLVQNIMNLLLLKIKTKLTFV